MKSSQLFQDQGLDTGLICDRNNADHTVLNFDQRIFIRVLDDLS